jgi:DNA-binding winged helix-turn-helix (wHTH) protein
MIDASTPTSCGVTSIYQFADFELDCRMRELRRKGSAVAMPARCFECLLFLIEQRERAVSRDELAHAVFGRHNVSDAQLGQVVLRARRVVGDDGNAQHMIRTVPRFGFRWVADISEVEPPQTLPAREAPFASDPPQAPAEQRAPRQGLTLAWLSAATATAMMLITYVPASRSQDAEQVLLTARQDFLAGRYQRGLAALDHLLERKDALGDARLRARALVQRARVEIKLDRHVDAEQDFTAAIALLDPHEDSGLLGKAHNGRAVARTALGRFDAAQEDLRQARGHLSRNGDLRSLAWVDANAGILWQRRRGNLGPDASAESDTFVGQQASGDPPRNDPGDGAAAGDTFVGPTTNPLGLDPPTTDGDALVLIELAAFHRLRLEWPEAHRHASKAFAMRDQLADPLAERTIALELVETLIGMGELQEARALLATYAADEVAACDAHRVGLLFAELAWRSGDPIEAIAIADRVLATASPEVGLVFLRRLYRLRLQLGGEMASPPPGLADDDSVDAWLIKALLARAHGTEQDTELAYQQALARAEGTPAAVVAVATTYLPWLIQRGSFDQAARMVEQFVPWTTHDYDAAALHMRWFAAIGDQPGWEVAAGHARELAGERSLPEMLDAPDQRQNALAHAQRKAPGAFRAMFAQVVVHQ